MSHIILQGIQYDAKSSYQRGSRKAPPLIRKALDGGSMNPYAENGVNVKELDLEDKGDFEIVDYFDIQKITSQHLQSGAKILTLGGDHSIAYPIIEAFHKHHGVLDILQIDAHTDLYDEFEGDKYSHACPFARIMEKKLAIKLVQVGIRALHPHQKMQAEKFGVEMITMDQVNIKKIPQFENPLYISVDLDGLDPAFAPGVSHHEPGGLTTRQVVEMIQNVKGEIVGADIVEYNPDRDHQDMTAFVGAKLLKELLSKF